MTEQPLKPQLEEEEDDLLEGAEGQEDHGQIVLSAVASSDSGSDDDGYDDMDDDFYGSEDSDYDGYDESDEGSDTGF